MSRVARRPVDLLAGLSELDAAEVVRCARALLRRPWLRESTPDGAVVPLIYRHRVVLSELFGSLLGYRLVVRRGWARLYKAGRGDDGTRGEAGFAPRTYAFLTLTVAVLEGGARQMLLSRLVEDVHAAAVEAGLTVTDDAADRAALTAALRHLVRLGVITETEGTVDSVLGQTGAEALITVDRDLIGEVVIGLSEEAESAAEVFAGPAVATEQVVRRKLLEDPAVYFADLPAAEAEWLRGRRRPEARVLSDVFGVMTESRLEGVAVLDPESRLSDIAFPGQSTVARLAMLALPVLLEESAEEELSEEDDEIVGDGRIPVTMERVRVVCADLVEEYPGTWSLTETADATRLAANVLDLLVAMRIAGRNGPQLWLNPVVHRFAVEPEGAGAPPPQPEPPERTSQLFETGKDRW